ncbi:MAG: hypothetical protein R3F11_09190 [Verrucomicrobiales bacterium]
MRIDMFDETGSPDVSIRIKHGSYHLPTDELRSDSRPRWCAKTSSSKRTAWSLTP